MYLDANNLYEWVKSQKLPVGGFKWIKKLYKANVDFIKTFDKDRKKGYILEVDNEYPRNLLNLHGDLPFSAEWKTIKKCNKIFCNINDNENYVVHIRALKQTLNHGLILKKVHRVIQFNQEAWLKEYIDKNTELGTEAENDFDEDFF